jgi:hypothetical protein
VTRCLFEKEDIVEGMDGGGERASITAASAAYLNQVLHLTASSVRSVRRASGMEECGNTVGVQAPKEPVGLSVIDHSMP